MSPLPQRKKTAEEIAQLRESLGIPTALEESTAPAKVAEKVDQLISNTHQAVAQPAVEPTRINPPAEAFPHGSVVSHSLKRSERPVTSEPPIALPAAPAPAVDVQSEPAPVIHSVKRVHSLKKSEQGPIVLTNHHLAAADSSLPVHRHSDREIEEMRRREALSLLQKKPVVAIPTRAHPIVVILGYLLEIAAVIGFAYYDWRIEITAGCVACALVIAAIIYLRNTYSRHHAAFITVIALFVIAFGALYYFPQLQFKHGP